MESKLFIGNFQTAGAGESIPGFHWFAGVGMAAEQRGCAVVGVVRHQQAHAVAIHPATDRLAAVAQHAQALGYL